VEFKTALQRGNRIQIPRLLRWEFKMENSQVLQLTVHIEGQWSSEERFYGQMGKDGRITIPKLTCSLLKALYGEQDITGAILEVELVPSEPHWKRWTNNKTRKTEQKGLQGSKR